MQIRAIFTKRKTSVFTFIKTKSAHIYTDKNFNPRWVKNLVLLRAMKNKYSTFLR